MSDNLRDRIAAALIEQSPVMKGHERDWVYGRGTDLADAVIAALETDYVLVPKGDHDDEKRLFKDGVWGCGEPTCKACY